MVELIMYGASDDLLEVEFTGFRAEEFNVDPDTSFGVAVSDGHLIRVRYDEDGIWRFTPIKRGSSDLVIEQGIDDRRHSDKVTLTGEHIEWVAVANEFVRKE